MTSYSFVNPIRKEQKDSAIRVKIYDLNNEKTGTYL